MSKIFKYLNYKNKRNQWVIHEIVIDIIIISIVSGIIYFLSVI